MTPRRRSAEPASTRARAERSSAGRPARERGAEAASAAAEGREVPSLRDRSSGLLLHPTSLPGAPGAGDLGPGAHRFVDFLAAAGMRWWQMLPVGPTGPGSSPYSSPSTFAGSPFLVSLDALARDGWLGRDELSGAPRARGAHVDYQAVWRFREARLRRAHERFSARASAAQRAALEDFRERARAWLDDYALFAALRRRTAARKWIDWDAGLRDREPAALARAASRLAGELELQRFVQFVFDAQWRALQERARARRVALLGDVPIFVDHDSADVWAHREMFLLDAERATDRGRRRAARLFSEDGQRWGNPLYDWAALGADGYAWWVERLRSTLARFDALRHRSLHRLSPLLGGACAGEDRAARALRAGARRALLRARARLDRARPRSSPRISGSSRPRWSRCARRSPSPGCACCSSRSTRRRRVGPPAHVPGGSVAYTGTHDNDTSVGWLRSLSRTPRGRRERALVMRYLGAPQRDFHWAMIRMAMLCPASLAIVPMQDVLGLGSEARMNTPGRARGNWTWRAPERALAPSIAARLRETAEAFGRI